MFSFIPRKYILNQLRRDKSKEYKFLIIRNGLIGDTVFITPIVYKLYNSYKNSEIDVVISNNSKEILEDYPGINKIFPLPQEFSLKKHILFFLSLRKNKYDCVFIQEVNTHYTIMSKLLRSKMNIGFKNGVSFLQDISVQRKGHSVPAEQLLVNCILQETNIDSTKLYISEKETLKAKELLQKKRISNKKIIAIQTTCSEKNSIRQLSLEKIAKLADALNYNFSIQIIFLGVNSDIPEVEYVRKNMKSKSLSLCGETNLKNLVAILKEVSLIIGPDTGTMHIANAIGTPVIMYMGYSDPNDTGPWDKNNKSKIITANLECIPCKFSNPKPKNWDYCKKNRPAICMDAINIDDFINNAKIFLNS